MIVTLAIIHRNVDFVLIGSELVHRRPDVWPKLLAFPVFVVAVAAAVKIVETLERRRTAAVPMLLYTEAALLLLAFGALMWRLAIHAMVRKLID